MGPESFLLFIAAYARATPSPTYSIGPSTVALTQPPLWQQDWPYAAAAAVVALIALLYKIGRDYGTAAHKRRIERQAEMDRVRAEAETLKRPLWVLSFNPSTYTSNYFEFRPTHAYGDGKEIEIPVLVKNVGERPSGTFQVELYVPRDLPLHKQTDAHGARIQTASNVSPIAGYDTYAIRFRSWDEDLRPGEIARLGTFSFFFNFDPGCALDYKIYWRLTSQRNGYTFPANEFGQIGVRLDLP